MQEQMQKWLILLGKLFGIKDIHYQFRPASSAGKLRESFIFDLVSSEPLDRHQLSEEVVLNSSISYTINKTWKTIYQVRCQSKRGLFILQSLEASRFIEPLMTSIFGDSITCFGCGPITQEPLIDESDNLNFPEFSMDIMFNQWVDYTFIERYMLVEHIELSGKAIYDGKELILYVVEPKFEVEVEEEEVIPEEFSV